MLLRFEEEVGVPLEVRRPGSIMVARTEADEAHIHAGVRRAQETALELNLISPVEARKLAPWFDPSNAKAMWYAPGDIYLEPSDLPNAYVSAFRSGGGIVREYAEVTAIGSDSNSVTHVEFRDGTRIETSSVVVAAGAWTPALLAMADAQVPLWPVRHQLVITTQIAGVDNTQPCVRILDSMTYTRPCNGGLMFGGFELDPWMAESRELPTSFRVAELPIDGAPIRELMALVADEFPPLIEAEWKEMRGGLVTVVPDGRFLVGPIGSLDGLWMIGGCNAGGLATSPALGKRLASWITTGERHHDLEPFDPKRFDNRENDDRFLREAALRTYTHKYGGEEAVDSFRERATATPPGA